MKPSLLLPSLVLACAVAVAPARGAGTAAGRAPAPKAPSAPRMALPFVQDDYTKALAMARARKVPLFVEAWAPW